MTRQMVNRGPFAWSTSKVIMRRSSVICWDVNGYYRLLGIGPPFVHATQREIRERYLALDGPNDARLTQAFTVFLNPAEKARYDALPLGEKYPDPETRYQAKVRSITRGDTVAVGARVVDGQVVYDVPEGYEMITGHADATGSLDSGVSGGQDGSRPAKDPYYPYSILLWDSATYDSLALKMWQDLLLQAAQETSRAPVQIGLGVTQGKGGWVVGNALGVWVALVDRFDYPTLSAARGMINEMAR